MRVVGLVALPGSRTFDVAVASEVWGVDRTSSGIGPFELRICAPGRRAVDLRPAGALRATHGVGGLDDCDLVVVPGRHDPFAATPRSVVAALRAAHARGAVVASLCSGAFTLAAAGLVDGRPATTHWLLLDELERAAPRADVRRDVLFTEADGVFTSAGVAGGVDLCLHLVRLAHGAEVAAALARRMVTPPAREGGQHQYVEAPVPSRPGRADMASIVDWAAGRIGEPIGVADLAARSGMSERTFLRAFRAATGSTPGRWLLLQRVRHAQRLLESTDLPVERVAERAGLGTAANLRRRMRAELGVGPSAYRRTFRAA
ncbi:Transcriptional regulator GlxA family, contains an amidase domain and an AraC-type DNA-binding HTH domain [Streptoalloteichus tenebrarius]|uniref:Transcriptional regulator GlxA family, contains an amidase domain and an AraC-type DNA-binding HTH domain n=1 Tax=Streptoalloteichus tenebrarius (strain ATCC 17920 / DSM 40477 / JCM 4838 / CBS 697.72 / NBRC 16177 / NCIMB 11028 / NRRL B-12390 / A12253. 1 / ISP 5477) TaxID=1933 RepID=A0ABT1HXR1_STRSD|nr:helix-turn-helix domain-containing protein [Streptoalloteichus tenebrarius]MCP2260313.1 Transcriptional regulator GlxA family, contains an amidase domain and an AraC-type DNA-binding HTH domain [Streptoalloteichus tenebrarius]BFF03063.1 helix-turn-helix domain-containing protein [Streptoalloteichus tenebrarius]